MATPKVSIIIPVYNTEKYLKRCMDSILGQTLREIEVILVDDGSKEPCAKLCDEYAAADSRVKVVHKENAGPGFARNAGLAVAEGEYVGFVDSDDYIKESMYEELYAAAVEHGADLCASGICFVGGNMFSSEDEYLEKDVFGKLTVFENGDMKNLLLGIVGALPHEPDDSRYGVSVWKNIFRRAVIEENRLQFMSERVILSEDTLFMIDFVKCAKKAVGLPKAYYNYCRNGDSFSKAYKADRLEKSMVFLKELERHIEDYVTKEEYGLYIDRLTQGFGRILCSQEIMHARENGIKFSALRKRLERICTQREIADVLKTYPYRKLPIKQAAFAFAMKYRLYLLQELMVILRDR